MGVRGSSAVGGAVRAGWGRVDAVGVKKISGHKEKFSGPRRSIFYSEKLTSLTPTQVFMLGLS